MKEEHIRCGDWNIMRDTLIKAKVQEAEENYPSAQYLGMRIIEDKEIPKNEARLVDRYGNVLKVFKV